MRFSRLSIHLFRAASRRWKLHAVFCVFPLTLALTAAHSGVGDPQVKTDHVWYPGELACSTFPRLFETQARLFQDVTGSAVETDEQKALAAWLWRNTHYFHGEEGAEDLWGKGFKAGGDLRGREYWTGLFAHGFSLCGTTHSQWVAEMQALFGHGRARGVGVAGHNSFEVFLTGGAYGEGKWALLDHDLSTVAFDEEGKRLLSIAEVQQDWKRALDQKHKPERQRGWPVCGLHPGDGAVFTEVNVAEYLAGYAGAPPMVHLRRGETLRRYFEPGLEDGRTFVFWGRNYGTKGIPGPERSLTWVNQPEKLFGAKQSVAHTPGQARYGNAVYTYEPDFSGGYREAVISEYEAQVTFAFQTPYIIAATPASDAAWGIYEPGGKNGLVLHGDAKCDVSVSVDGGQVWHACGALQERLDLTDHVKGRRNYLLRLHAGAKSLAGSKVKIVTVCQANAAIMPRLTDGGSEVRFLAQNQAVISAGTSLPHAKAHVVDGAFGTPEVTIQLASPRGERPLALHAAAHVLSGNPPDPKVKYRIDVSIDGGRSWHAAVENWTSPRRDDDPKSYWSQSMCWGSLDLSGDSAQPVRVRFSNTGRRNYARAEAHLVYRTSQPDPAQVTFAWEDERGPQQASHVFPPAAQEAVWKVPTQQNVRTKWVEFKPAPAAAE